MLVAKNYIPIVPPRTIKYRYSEHKLCSASFLHTKNPPSFSKFPSKIDIHGFPSGNHFPAIIINSTEEKLIRNGDSSLFGYQMDVYVRAIKISTNYKFSTNPNSNGIYNDIWPMRRT